MIGRQHLLTYIYLLVYILLSSGVILYNKVRHCMILLHDPEPFSAPFVFFYIGFWFLIYKIKKQILTLRIHLQWVLSTKYFNFPYPITLTMIHMGFSGAVAFFLIRIFKVGCCLNLWCFHLLPFSPRPNSFPFLDDYREVWREKKTIWWWPYVLAWP